MGTPHLSKDDEDRFVASEFPCAIAVVVVFDSLPVAGGIQSPLLLKRAVGDCRLSPVECPAFLITQAIQPVVRIPLIVAGEHVISRMRRDASS